MKESIKCWQCNRENPAGISYCENCNAFLMGGKTNDKRLHNIWELRGTSDVTVPPLKEKTQRYYVVCPRCQNSNDAMGGNLPPFCVGCGYYFRPGTDRVISDEQQKNEQHVGKSVEIDNKVRSKTGSVNDRNIMPTVTKTSKKSLRLLAEGHMPECVDEGGAIVGKSGTIMKWLDTDCSLKFYLVPSVGWYLLVLEGEPRINGRVKSAGRKIQINHGDDILMGNIHIGVQIFE